MTRPAGRGHVAFYVWRIARYFGRMRGWLRVVVSVNDSDFAECRCSILSQHDLNAFHPQAKLAPLASLERFDQRLQVPFLQLPHNSLPSSALPLAVVTRPAAPADAGRSR